MAKDEQEALDISWKAKKARAKKNLEIVNDQTDGILGSKDEHNLKELLDDDRKGFVGLKIPHQSFADVLKGVAPKDKPKWMVQMPY